jgi:uncharacterized protein YwlG (UPF0340 family)
VKTPDRGIAFDGTMQGVHIETLQNPGHYTSKQIEEACRIAAMLSRGKLVLAERPKG